VMPSDMEKASAIQPIAEKIISRFVIALYSLLAPRSTILSPASPSISVAKSSG
jgi:hypothetical protein